MHVLVIPSWYPRSESDVGGSFFREQAIALARAGCRVGVATAQLASLRDWRSIPGSLRVVRFEVDEGVPTCRAVGVNWFPRLPVAARRLWMRNADAAFRAYVERYGSPDVIHVQSMLDAGALALSIHARTGIPYVVTEHSTAFVLGPLSASALSRAARIARGAARTLAVSPQLARTLDSSVGGGGRGWEPVPNLVSERFARHPLVRRSDPGFTFINVALMEEKKRQASLLRAFEKAFTHDDEVRLVLVGDGPERTALERLSARLGLGDRVRFTGMLPRDRVLEEMASADAFVLSSRYETFGVAVAEALALGKPVVSTRSGGPESIVRPEDGLLVPVDDVDALASGMRQLRTHAGDYDAEEIRRACLARFGERAVTSRLLDLYREVA